MGRSLSILWVHVIFSTKNREPLINAENEPFIFSNIKEALNKMNCRLLSINGVEDHIHILFQLHPSVCLADCIKQIKASTSFNRNLQNKNDYFQWQEGYAAYSISQNRLEKVSRYIQNQKIIHKNRSFKEELEKFNPKKPDQA